MIQSIDKNETRIIYFLVNAFAIYFLSKNMFLSLIISIIGFLVFVLHGIKNVHEKRDVFKRIMLFVTIILYYSLYFTNFKYDKTILQYLIVLNVLVVGVYESFFSQQKSRYINGLLLIFAALYTPKIMQTTSTIYLKNYTWVILCTLLLLSSYLYTNCFIDESNSQYNTIIAIIAPLLLSVFNKKNWLKYRAMALTLLLLSDDLFGKLGDKMKMTHNFPQLENKFTIFNVLLSLYYFGTYFYK
jgi:hypothetical protein